MGAESYPYLDVKTLTDIRATHRRSLELLATQASKFGVQVPVPIEHQIKDAIAEVNAVNAELARRGIANDDPPPNSDVQTVIHHYHGTTIIGNQGVAIGGNADGAQINTGDDNTIIRDNGRATAAPATLRALIDRVQTAASAAQTDDEELADQLSSVAIQLRDARRKLLESQKALRALGASHPVGAELAQGIGALVEGAQ